MPVVPAAAPAGFEGNSGAGGTDNLLLLLLLRLSDFVDEEFDVELFDASEGALPAMVVVKLASKAATASGERVCEKLRGGKGTDPGAEAAAADDAAKEEVGLVPDAAASLVAASIASFQDACEIPADAAVATPALAAAAAVIADTAAADC